MSEWHEFSLEFRNWVHHCLKSWQPSAGAPVCLASEDGHHIICGHTSFHVRGAPCETCAEKGRCPVAKNRPQLADAVLPGLPMHRVDKSESRPGFQLIGLTPGTPDSHPVNLAGLATLIEHTWLQIHPQEKRLAELAASLRVAEDISKLSTRTAPLSAVLTQLDNGLTHNQRVNRWYMLIDDPPHQLVLSPGGPDFTPETTRQLQTIISRLHEIKTEDFMFLGPKHHPEIYEETTKILSLIDKQGDLLVIPLSKPNHLGGDHHHPEGLEVLIAELRPGEHPPAPMMYRMGLFCQLALVALKSIRRLDEARQLKAEVVQKESLVQQSIQSLPGFEQLVGESPAIAELRTAILRAAKSSRTVLLVGEQGTGKELVAKLIHQHSQQGDFRYVCGRVAAELNRGLESWKSFHPANRKMEEVVLREFRDVPPALRPADLAREHAAWRPRDVAMAEIIESEAEKLPVHSRYLFRSVIRRLLPHWQEDRFFNFFEYDSGAAATQHIAAELFGFPDKRFSDAEGGPGRFQTASHCGGTLFLDNIHHLDLSVQKALLKATEIRHEDRRVTRAGGGTSEPIHIRIIAATTVDLRTLITNEEFLVELASRLTCEVLPVPPLNNRREDIPLLAQHFARMSQKEIAFAACEPLQAIDWHKSNVRGLQNLVETAASNAEGPVIGLKEIRQAMVTHNASASLQPLTNEQVMIKDALRQCGNIVSKAAQKIGWSRQKLTRLMKEYGIRRDN